MKKKAIKKQLNRIKAQDPQLTPDQWEKVAIDLAHKLVEALEKAGYAGKLNSAAMRSLDLNIYHKDNMAQLMLWDGLETTFIHEQEGGRIDYRSL